MTIDDKELERVLREEEPYLDNGTFSRSVMRALPPRRRWRRSAWRKKIVGTAAVLGLMASWPFLPSAMAQPVVGQAVASQWFVTVSVLFSLGLVAVISWWFLAAHE